MSGLYSFSVAWILLLTEYPLNLYSRQVVYLTLSNSEAKTEGLTVSPLLGMRRCILLGTGMTWSTEWGHIVDVMPSPMLPCQESPWLCSTWPSLKTSLITFRLEAIAAGFCNALSHCTTPWRIVKHLGFTILFLLLADKWIIVVWKYRDL